MSEYSIDNKIKPWGPTEDGENLDILIKHLNKVIIDGTATNIGVIGPYGSGKSSFIETFLKDKDKKDSIIRVSLANFNATETSIINDDTLQIGIVQQILYHFYPEKIPLSRFHRIQPPELNKFIFIFIAALYPILFYFGVINYQFIDSFLQKYIYSFCNPLYCLISYWYIYILVHFLLICSFGYISWSIYKAILNSRKVSLSIDKVSIGINNSKTHILDKYLEEILYVFDANPQKRIVILEDMDRFSKPIEILTKLREINHLLNNRGKEPVIFIYAVEEKLIPDPEKRLKFFNFIIPIIPYSDQNNSESILIQEFPDNNRDLLELISIYIYDYRFIQHIQNEFLFINNILNKENKLSIDTILALVCYKNLYPDDFNSLRNNTGDLYSGIELVRKSGLEQYHQNLKNYDDFKTELQSGNIIDSKQLNLISRLLISEYISIDYYDYISHFIPGKMDIHDWDFVRRVRLVNINTNLQTQPLINPTLVINRLELEYFTRGFALNYSIFFQLLEFEFLSNERDPKLQELLNYITKKDKKEQFIDEFINGLISEKGILLQPKYINAPLKDIIREYTLNFSKINSKTPPDLLHFIVSENYYTLNEINLKQIYDLSSKSLWDMSYYWEKAKELSEDIANKALENIMSSINKNEYSLIPQEQGEGYPVLDYVPMLKEIILQPSLYNLSFIDNLKDDNIVITYDGDYVEKLKSLSFNRIKVLIENNMIVVALFTSISTNNKTLSDDEKIELWNIYIEKDIDLVQKELTTPVLDIIFPDWGILKKGSSFTINNNQDNLNFCEFLKENKSISSYYNYIKGEAIQVNRRKKHELDIA